MKEVRTTKLYTSQVSTSWYVEYISKERSHSYSITHHRSPLRCAFFLLVLIGFLSAAKKDSLWSP